MHSRALRTPLPASPKMGSPIPALWSTGVTQRQKGAGIPAQVSAGSAELFNPGPEESDSCLSSGFPPRFLLVSACWLLFSCAPQACDYPNPRAWLPSGPINQRYQHHSPAGHVPAYQPQHSSPIPGDTRSLQERWDRELEKGARTSNPSSWDGAVLPRDFAPSEPLLQCKHREER